MYLNSELLYKIKGFKITKLPIELVEYILKFNVQEYIILENNSSEGAYLSNIKVKPHPRCAITVFCGECFDGIIDSINIPFNMVGTILIECSQLYYFDFKTRKPDLFDPRIFHTESKLYIQNIKINYCKYLLGDMVFSNKFDYINFNFIMWDRFYQVSRSLLFQKYTFFELMENVIKLKIKNEKY